MADLGIVAEDVDPLVEMALTAFIEPLATSQGMKTTFSGPNFAPNSSTTLCPVFRLTSEMQTLAPSERSLAAKCLPSPCQSL